MRIFRLIRVARLLRQYGVSNIGRSLLRDRAGSALLTLLLIGVLVLEFGSLAMLYVERSSPDANITTAADALWYVIVTMSTVGYGDAYPVSTVGREMATLIIVVGVGIFGTLTGYLANLFLAPRKEAPSPEGATTTDAVGQRLRQLQELLAEQQAAVAELERMIKGSSSR